MSFDKTQKKRLVALGERVKEIRNEQGLSLMELAHKIEKDPQSIHRLEKGGVNPSFLYLTEVCDGLGISVSELLDGL